MLPITTASSVLQFAALCQYYVTKCTCHFITVHFPLLFKAETEEFCNFSVDHFCFNTIYNKEDKVFIKNLHLFVGY